jgi:CRP-like cAMP-binding protein
MLRPELAALIIERAERVKLTHGEVLFHAREPAQFVYFPTDCLVSMVVSLETGNSVEAATVGNDGYVGISAFLGMGHEDLMGMAQIPGETLRLPVEDFRHCLEDDGFRAVMGASTAKTLATISQSIACNTFHAVNERLARWLLLVRDATERHEFPLTHEFIAIMLGVHRPTVSVAIGLLETAGLIEHRRGLIRIVAPEALAEAACECYKLSSWNRGDPGSARAAPPAK